MPSAPSSGRSTRDGGELARGGRGTNLTILAWHNVAATPFFYGGPAAFARQLKLISRLGTPVPLAAAVDALIHGRPLPPRAVALTFDDGYRDNLDLALPLLRQLQLPATFFLVPGYLGREARCWWETIAWALGRARERRIEWDGRVIAAGPDLAAAERRRTAERICVELKAVTHEERERRIDELIARLRPAGDSAEVAELFVDWQGAATLAAGGEIGAHTLAHPILAHESAEAQRADLSCCRSQLSEAFGQPIDLLAYPNGKGEDYDQTTVAATVDAGFQAAVTTIEGINGHAAAPFELQRFVLGPRWDPGMARYLGRIFLRAARNRTG